MKATGERRRSVRKERSDLPTEAIEGRKDASVFRTLKLALDALFKMSEMLVEIGACLEAHREDNVFRVRTPGINPVEVRGAVHGVADDLAFTFESIKDQRASSAVEFFKRFAYGARFVVRDAFDGKKIDAEEVDQRDAHVLRELPIFLGTDECRMEEFVATHEMPFDDADQRVVRLISDIDWDAGVSDHLCGMRRREERKAASVKFTRKPINAKLV